MLHKPVTTVGRALGNDVAVAGDGLAETHAQVLFDGRDFNLEEVDKQAEIQVNGKKKRRARLVHGDRVTLGDVSLSFSMFDDPQKVGNPGVGGAPSNISETQLNVTNQQLAAFRKLYEFSEKLMTMTEIEPLLEAMLDAVIDVTGAEKGLILLNDDAFMTGPKAATQAQAASPLPAAAPSSPGPAGPAPAPGPAHEAGSTRRIRIRAARNVNREAIVESPSGSALSSDRSRPGAGGAISDSIVRNVLESGRAVIVSDALNDAQFKSSESVLALRLSSVMCAPFSSQGQVQGVLYVGNDRVKNLFDKNQLDVLSIFASQASLILENAMLLNALRADKEKLVAELKDKRFGEIIGACSSMMEVFRKLQKVATTDISVLITGETGTGKELIAKELHRRSN
ncbi:MAG TPA: GAF domain-containing protein, partial [Polyangiaceae bacterium]|nr:GAF domain-containing protein [Polyangiaceae bacterium]